MIEMVKTHNICFLGQTGYGKSSLINQLFGTKFSTDPLVSCTKELYSVSVLHKQEDVTALITVYDTPGIGEFSTNSIYQMYYNYAVSQADHIVLVLTLDRTDSTSQDLLESIVPYLKNSDVKFTVALNRVDSGGVGEKNEKYNAWNDAENAPSIECWQRINERLETIRVNYENELDFLPFEIIPVCALRRYGIDELKNRILE